MHRNWRHFFRPLILLAAATAFLLSGCGGGSGEAADPPATPAAADPPGSATVGGAAQTEAVTITGAQGAQLVVPPGALAQPVTVRLALDSTGAPALPADLTAAGPMVALTPHESQFALPLRLSLPAPTAPLAPGQRYAIAKASPGGAWSVLTATEQQGGMLVAEIDSFSFLLPVIIQGIAILDTAWNATLSLDCGAQDCNALVGPASVTLRVSTNNGMLPAGCSAQSRLVYDRIDTYSNGSSTTPAFAAGVGIGPAQTGGTASQSLSPGNAAVVRTGVRFRVSMTGCGANRIIGSVGAQWAGLSRFGIHVLPVAISAPDVPVDGTATAQVTLVGGATTAVENRDAVQYPQVPTATSFATVEWERSNDGGASWQPAGTSYQHLAEPSPFGAELAPWRYWRVSHSFRAEGSFGGRVQLRARACVDARSATFNGPVVTERRCNTSAVATANVLQQSLPPSFATLPRPQLVLTGQTASFSAQATGLPAPTLQWQTRPANSTGAWTDVPAAEGGTGAGFTTRVLALADNGVQFRVVASNADGRTESPPVSVSVSDQPQAPVITAELSSVRALRGGDATFAVGVRGTEPLNYEWRVGGQVVVGQNAPVLNLQAVQAAATVQLTVSNAAGSVASRTVDLRVFDGAVPEAPVVIDVQPVPISIATGQTAVFAVRASGGGNLHYRWQYNGNDVVGFPDSPVLMLANAQPGFNGSYRVVVSNAGSSVTSDSVTLQVAPPPQLQPPGWLVQPVGLSLVAGQTATFAGVARGNGTLSYQWLREGVPIPGATQPVLTLPAVAAGDVGNYALRATDGSGAVLTSDVVGLAVAPAPGAPVFTLQTLNVSALPGDTPTIAMAVQGTPAPNCLWLKNGALVPGATDCSGLTLPAVNLADDGAVFTAIAYNAGGAVVGGPAVLHVTAPALPAITTQPVDVSVTEGGSVSLFAGTSGNPPPDEQWFVGNQRIPTGSLITFTEGNCTVGYDQTRGQLRLLQVPLACNGLVFTLRAVNSGGTATSNPATLTVTPAVPAGALTATQVVAGYEWSMVLRPDRTVWGWGGLHSTAGTVVVANLAPSDQARRPVQMYPGTLTDVRQIAGWYDGFWALKGEPGSAGSRVLHWGNARSASDGRGADGAGNLGTIPQFRVNAAPVEMLERRSVNGTLQAAPVDRVCSIAATSDRALMIRAIDAFGSPTDCNPGSAKTVWVAGTLTQFGADALGVVVPVQGLPAGVPARLIAQQATAQSSSGPMLVLMEDGSAYGWGNNIGNLFGLATPANTGTVGNNVAPQALPGSWGTLRDAAFSYVGLIGQRADGSAMVSGRNDNGELGIGPQAGGTVNNGPLSLLAGAGTALDGVQALASAQVQVSLALRQGRILAWGAANQPLQGGSNARIDYPRLLPASGDGWRAISAANAHALAIAANGAVYTWGNGQRGALGNGVDGGSALAPTLLMQ